jgi:DNA processing protein
MITHEQILTLLNIKGLGWNTAEEVCRGVSRTQNIHRAPSEDIEDFFDLVEKVIGTELEGVAVPEYDDFRKANEKAKHILSESERRGIGVISRFDKAFPFNLRYTVDESGRRAVPLLMYYKGNLSITQQPALAVIGTRTPTPDAMKAGHAYAGSFASIGVNIVSGLAPGCDTAGHRGALDAGGVTTAFLAQGLDTVDSPLAEEILAKGGLLMSEYPVGEAVRARNLVLRDRLQAGLADAVLVVQTGVKGGTMHAVRAAKASNDPLSNKPLIVVDYHDSQGEIGEGNLLLKREGAIVLPDNPADLDAECDRCAEIIWP